ncbi:MAG TPA: NAD(P)-dependent alcohol dehydrogenase [Gaiellaceae bacterium]|nr:NAD(P)-dependent alcohol dehydrogenase [Gaiellaceae bacterium]
MEEKAMMKALVRHRYGGPGVVRVEEVDQPALTDDHVLVRVRASSLNKADWHELRGWPRFLRPLTRNGVLRPKSGLFGTDFAGVVEAVGKDVTDLAPGDEVFGGRSGAFAEYVSATNVVRKPSNVSFEEAATMGIAGLTALQGLRDHARLEPGERVLINGASGGVGTLAVQIAKALGAHVTAVCSTRNVEQARALGADRVLDYTREDFTRGPERYDLIADVAGGHSWSAMRRVLEPDGRLVVVGAHGSRGQLRHIAAVRLASLRSKERVRFFVAKFNKPDLQALADLLESGALKPAIDRTYELDDAQDALRTFGEGHVRGKLVLTM